MVDKKSIVSGVITALVIALIFFVVGWIQRSRFFVPEVPSGAMLLFAGDCPVPAWTPVEAADGLYIRASDKAHGLAPGVSGGDSTITLSAANLPDILLEFFWRKGVGTLDYPNQHEGVVRDIRADYNAGLDDTNKVALPIGGHSQPIDLTPRYYAVALCQKK